MTANRSSWRGSEPSDQADGHGEECFRELGRIPSGPDLTRSVMGRLGFMRLRPEASRRRRRQRWMRRTSVLLAAAGALTAGSLLHRQSLEPEDGPGPTVYDAVHRDLQQGVRQINSALEAIRGRFVPSAVPDRVPRDPPSEPPPALDEFIEQSAAAPGRWV